MVRTDTIKKSAIILYICLSFFEFALKTGAGGSAVKFIPIFAILVFFYENYVSHRHIVLTKTVTFMLLWEFAITLSLLWSRNAETGIYYCTTLLLAIAIVILIDNTVWDEKNKKACLNLFSYVGVIYSLALILNGTLYHGTGIRYTFSMFGYETDPNNAAALIAPIVVVFLDNVINKKKIVFSVVGLCLVMIAVFFLGSRGGFISVLVSVCVYYLFFSKQKSTSIQKKARNIIIIILFFIVIYEIVLRVVDPNLIRRLLVTDSYEDGSGRLVLWQKALVCFKESPIIGRGVGSLLLPYSHSGIHNMYLLVLCDVGLFSFVPFVGMLVCCCKNAIKKDNAVILGMLFSMMTSIFFLDAYPKKYLWNIIFLCAIVCGDKCEYFSTVGTIEK